MDGRLVSDQGEGERRDFIQGTTDTRHYASGVLQRRTRGIYPKREAHARGRIIEYGLYIYIILFRYNDGEMALGRN